MIKIVCFLLSERSLMKSFHYAIVFSADAYYNLTRVLIDRGK